MIATATMPSLDSIVRVLEGLTGKKVQAHAMKVSRPLAGSPHAPLFGGFFATDGSDGPSISVVADLPVALGVVGALAGMPPGILGDQLKSGQLTPPLMDDLREVMNVLSSVFNSPGGEHVRFDDLEEIRSMSGSRLEAFTKKMPARFDLEVSISPAPPGRLTILRLNRGH